MASSPAPPPTKNQNPHFFKIILDNSISQHKLGIPRKFVQDYGDCCLSSPVILKVPGGSEWKVEIVKSEGQIWLQNGWREFAEYYSVVEGSFLVFEYVKSDSEFNVTIFNKTATEIDYPRDNSDKAHLDKAQFFKIILARSVTEHKLGIPRKFVRKYGYDLSSPVILKVPSGAKWKVETVRSEGEIWLGNGWREFAEYYSVVQGSFVVFEYEKSNYEFNVFIFDNTVTEIDYPLSVSKGDYSDRANLDQEQGPQEPNTKKIKLEPSAKTLDKSCRKGRQRISKTVIQKKALSHERKANAVHKATSNFESENPSFRIVLKPPLFNKRSILVIPQSFARKYLNKNGDAALKVSNDRTWFVNYYTKISSGIPKTRIEHFSWSKFVRDNHLKVGNVCVFELIDPVQTTFRVAISKYSKAANLRKLLGNSKESIKKGSSHKERKLSFSNGSEAKEATENLTSANLSFRAKISPACLKNCLVYVAHHIIRKIDPETKFVRLKFNNRCWSVKLIHNSETLSYLSGGWAAFARENALKVGDICTFQLINNSDRTPLINVSVDRKTKPQVAKVEQPTSEIPDEVFGQFSSSRKRKARSTLSSSQPCKMAKKVENFTEKSGKGTSKQSMREETGTRERLSRGMPSNPSQKLTSGNPFFQVVMTETHAKGRANVNVPRNFVNNLDRVTRVAQLQVDNKVWSAKLIIYPHVDKSVLSTWTRFARDNSLKAGDVCTFELIDPQKLLIKVSILRDTRHV